MIRWNLDLPEETDQNVRKYLDQMQGGESDLSRFVDQAMLISSVEALWERNKDLSPESAQKLADTAELHRPKTSGNSHYLDRPQIVKSIPSLDRRKQTRHSGYATFRVRMVRRASALSRAAHSSS